MSEDELTKMLTPVVKSAITSYGGGDESLKPRAWILAMEAAKTFDPKKGASLQTHIHGNLRRLNRIRAERSVSVHIPESVRSDSAGVKEFIQQYQADHGIEPSQDAIADGLSISRKRVRKALATGESPMSLFESEKGDAPTSRNRDRYDIWTDYVYHDLSETDKKIMEWLTGYGGSVILPKNEVARRLGVSPAAVSQRVTRISAKLQEGQE